MSTPGPMAGKTALVTGANAGMGLAITRGLASLGAAVVMVARDRDRGEAAHRQVTSEVAGADLELLVADLSSQRAIRELAAAFRERHPALHVLVNNAGAHVQEHRLSVDGVEMNLAVNHLSAFQLTNLLLEPLRAGAPARVVNVASNAMTRTIDSEALRGTEPFEPWEAYGRAKLAMVMCGYALARRLDGAGVTVNALHPGLMATKIVDDVVPPLARPFVGLIKRFLKSPEQGARTALHLATAPELARVSGRYFVDRREARSTLVSYDVALQERVWEASARLVGLAGPDGGAA